MKLLILTMAMAASTAAFGQDSSSSASLGASANASEMKASDVVPSQTQRKDIDDEITNAKLRAETGSKSVWSIQSTFIYQGGSMQEPFASERPTLSPGTARENDVSLSGQISAKYRLTDHDSLNLGLGVGWLKPGNTGQEGQSQDPYLTYTRAFKAGSVQNVLSASATKYTQVSAVDAKDNFNLDVNYTLLTSVGTSKWEVGVNADASRDFFSQNIFKGAAINEQPTETQLSLYPFAEYAFTDKYSFRTVYRGMTFQDTQNSQGTFKQDSPTQSAGIGISVTRDIYLYPNLQWVWGDLRADKTNVALQADINL